MIEEILKQYATLKIKEKEIKEEMADLNPQIVQYMSENDIEKQPTSLGDFSLAQLKDWKYSKDIEKAERKVKALKAEEQADGTATFTEKLSLRFNETK